MVCEASAAAAGIAVPGKKNAPTDPFYLTPAWRAMRAFVLQRDGYRCVICGMDVSARGAARVDHIKPIREGGARLDPRNLRSLCIICDGASHRERGHGGPRREQFRGHDVRGYPIDPNPNNPWSRRA